MLKKMEVSKTRYLCTCVSIFSQQQLEMAARLVVRAFQTYPSIVDRFVRVISRRVDNWVKFRKPSKGLVSLWVDAKSCNAIESLCMKPDFSGYFSESLLFIRF